MSNEEFIETLVTRLNEAIDVPLLGEEAEARMLRYIVTKAEPLIPPEWRPVMLSVADGIDSTELDRAERYFAHACNATIDIPWVPETQEATLVWNPLASMLRGYAEAGLALVM